MSHKTINCNHLNQRQLAERWSISQRTLERWRAIGNGPIFLKIGGRVVYRIEDILTYEEKHLSVSTSPQVYDNTESTLDGPCANDYGEITFKKQF